jgi:hypothetical protein
MTGGADTRRIDLAAEGFVVEHCVDDRAEIDGSQPPQRKGQASPDAVPPAPWDRRMSGRRGAPAAGAASRAALPALKNGTVGDAPGVRDREMSDRISARADVLHLAPDSFARLPSRFASTVPACSARIHRCPRCRGRCVPMNRSTEGKVINRLGVLMVSPIYSWLRTQLRPRICRTGLPNLSIAKKAVETT